MFTRGLLFFIAFLRQPLDDAFHVDDKIFSEADYY